MNMRLRLKKIILEAEQELTDKVWYNRHQCYKQKMLDGIEPKCDPKIWEQAKAAAKRIEEKYKDESLQWTDFEWGMLNGKLSAIRWVMGEDWDMLDT
jgi:hypothetical protein